MKLIINSNRVIATLIKDASSRYILFFPKFEFYAPEFLTVELEKYKEEIREKAKLSKDQFEKIYADAISRVHLIALTEYQDKLDEAEQIMTKIDIKDAIFIAIGLALKIEGVWTEDVHFTKQKRIKVYSTHDLIELIKQSEEDIKKKK